MAIAEGATEHIYQNKNLNVQAAQELVKQTLSNMRFGKDGYFFAYDFDGTALVVPCQKWRIGKNWIDLEDRNGTKLIQGLSNKRIAQEINVSVRTVETHKRNIKQKLGVDSTVGLMRYAIDYGLDR